MYHSIFTFSWEAIKMYCAEIYLVPSYFIGSTPFQIPFGLFTLLHLQRCRFCILTSEREGFEPSVGCPTQHFQCCTFGRSDISPIMNGERGIRTPGTRRFNGFRDRPIQPLSHLSKSKYSFWFSISQGAASVASPPRCAFVVGLR